MASFLTFLLLFLALFIYFFPTVIAFGRRYHNRYPILLLNLFLGWTLLGWLSALIWACLQSDKRYAAQPALMLEVR